MNAAHDIPIRGSRGRHLADGPKDHIFGVNRPVINITPIERFGRIAIGLLGLGSK